MRVFARTGNVSLAARAARCGRRTVYEWLDADQRFKQLYSEALEDAIDELELEAHRRGVEGVDVPVFHGGVQIGAIRRYSDALLALLLKRWRPQLYGAGVDKLSAAIPCEGCDRPFVPLRPTSDIVSRPVGRLPRVSVSALDC